QTAGSGIFILLAVGTPSTGSGNLYCQWELSPGSSELGSELTSLAGSELGSELTSLAGSELGLASYSNFDDIQAAGSDTHPPMLDRTDYDSWSQRIWLYCRRKENGIYILQSIDHGPFELGTTRDTLGATPEGGVLLGTERPRTTMSECFLLDLSSPKKTENLNCMIFERFKMFPGENINDYYVRFHKLVNDMRNIRMTMLNIQLNSKFVNNMSPEWDRNFAWVNGAAGNGGAHIRAGNVNAGQGKPIKCFNSKGLEHIARNCNQPKRDADVDDHPVRDLALNDDNIFQADKCDAFDSDVDDEPIAQSIFMANLSSAGITNQQADPFNASVLSEVHDLENAIDPCDDNQDEHEINNEVQQKNIIDSTRNHMGNSNVTPYEQYLSINDVFVVPSCASSVSNDAYVLHDNDAYVFHDPLVTELNIYKE
nr:hypothetical protein [Tanacetum cinerariifolium]